MGFELSSLRIPSNLCPTPVPVVFSPVSSESLTIKFGSGPTKKALSNFASSKNISISGPSSSLIAVVSVPPTIIFFVKASPSELSSKK